MNDKNISNDVPNMEQNLLLLAKRIGDTQMLLAKARISTSKHQSDLDARKLFLTPPDGWEGKNEGERKISAEITFTNDVVCKEIKAGLLKEIAEMADYEATLASLEAERRGIEWVITNKLVEALHDRWNGLNPGRVLASQIAVSNAREAALDEVDAKDIQRSIEESADEDLPF